MTPLKQITLRRVEGIVSELSSATVHSFKAADAVCQRWAKTAPTDGSYHKVDVMVEWANGLSLTYCFGLRTLGMDRIDLAGDCQNRLLYSAGQLCPKGVSQQAYKSAISFKPGQQKDASRILRECQIS